MFKGWCSISVTCIHKELAVYIHSLLLPRGGGWIVRVQVDVLARNFFVHFEHVLHRRPPTARMFGRGGAAADAAPSCCEAAASLREPWARYARMRAPKGGLSV